MNDLTNISICCGCQNAAPQGRQLDEEEIAAIKRMMEASGA